MGKAVFLDHEGGLDDFLSLLLLLSYDGVDLLGISVTPADTLIEAAVPATRKILDLGGRSDVPVAGGTLEGRHPFPLEWRGGGLPGHAPPVPPPRSGGATLPGSTPPRS